MGYVRSVSGGIFPLDEELGLLPGRLMPHSHEQVVRLGGSVPFEEAAELLEALTGVKVSGATVRRMTERAGAEEVKRVEEAVAALETGKGEITGARVEKLWLGVDGAMVPLRGGEWAEVKTLSIGEVETKQEKEGEWEVKTSHLSYFSRLTDAVTFQRQSLLEAEQRGVNRVKQVAATTDGAEWIQEFIDYHRPDAARILDFPHAAERFGRIAEICRTAGVELGEKWRETQLHDLKHQGGQVVLPRLAALQEAHPTLPLAEPITYLQKRLHMLRYPTFRQDGWPIGSGSSESANKLVVQDRLKRAGMHWHRAQVNPMLALRNLICSNRWLSTWPILAHRLRQPTPHKQKSSPPTPQPTPNTVPQFYRKIQHFYAAQPPPPTPPPAKQPYRPSPNHPWNRDPIGRLRFKSPSPPKK